MIHSALSGHYSAFDDEDRLCGWWIHRKLEKLPDRVISTLDDDGVKENNLPDCPRALGELDAMKPEASRLIFVSCWHWAMITSARPKRRRLSVIRLPFSLLARFTTTMTVPVPLSRYCLVYLSRLSARKRCT